MLIQAGFFGITRSLRSTIDSIRANILAPLRQVGEVRVYAHFHVPDTIDNPRSGEAAVPVDGGEAALLQADICVLERQTFALIADPLAQAHAYPDLLADDYRSVGNLCFQLRSLARLWDVMQQDCPAGAAPSCVVFLRPDLRYLDALPIGAVLARMRDETADLAVPPWHGWGGLNDRFAVAAPTGAGVYASRGALLPAAMAARGGLHGESLLSFAVRQANMRVVDLPVRAVRVRGGGVEEARDLREFGLRVDT